MKDKSQRQAAYLMGCKQYERNLKEICKRKMLNKKMKEKMGLHSKKN